MRWVTEPSLDGIPQCSARAMTFQAGESLHPQKPQSRGQEAGEGLASGRVPRSDKAARITRLCSEPPNPPMSGRGPRPKTLPSGCWAVPLGAVMVAARPSWFVA